MKDEILLPISEFVDGNAHVTPIDGPTHIESVECWCLPELLEDYTDDGGTKVYLHKEIH